MPSRSVESCYRKFSASIASVEKLVRTANQGSTARVQSELFLITEAGFLRAFREYEGFLEETFVHCMREKELGHRRKAKSSVNARSYFHARDIMKSSMTFLDWTTPDTVSERAEVYLKDGWPFRDVITGAKTDVADMKCMRNEIAHASQESNTRYRKMLLRKLTTLPAKPMAPGEFLLRTTTRNNVPLSFFEYYLSRLEEIGQAISGYN